MKYLEIKNIKKKFTNKNVLNNIDYKFSTGTIYALLGENGAGKTTLVSIISGIKKATDGKIVINEKIFDKGFNSVKQANQNKIRITHQHPTINDELTVYEYCLIANNRKGIFSACRNACNRHGSKKLRRGCKRSFCRCTVLGGFRAYERTDQFLSF